MAIYLRFKLEHMKWMRLLKAVLLLIGDIKKIHIIMLNRNKEKLKNNYIGLEILFQFLLKIKINLQKIIWNL